MTSADLRTILLERDLSQRKLSKLCNVDERTVRRWCDGRKDKLAPHVEALVYFALKNHRPMNEARP